MRSPEGKSGYCMSETDWTIQGSKPPNYGLPRSYWTTKDLLDYQGLTGLPRAYWTTKDLLDYQGLTGLPRAYWTTKDLPHSNHG